MPYKVTLCELDKRSSSSSKIEFQLVDYSLNYCTWDGLGKVGTWQFALVGGHGPVVKAGKDTDYLLVATGKVDCFNGECWLCPS